MLVSACNHTTSCRNLDAKIRNNGRTASFSGRSWLGTGKSPLRPGCTCGRGLGREQDRLSRSTLALRWVCETSLRSFCIKKAACAMDFSTTTGLSATRGLQSRELWDRRYFQPCSSLQSPLFSLHWWHRCWRVTTAMDRERMLFTSETSAVCSQEL